MTVERDPSGLDPHAPGAKLDAGKIRPSLVLRGFPRAIWAVAEVATYGANKYSDGGWLQVPNGLKRYEDAQLRHMLKEALGEVEDPESELLHLAHAAWGALARLELYLREQEAEQRGQEAEQRGLREAIMAFLRSSEGAAND